MAQLALSALIVTSRSASGVQENMSLHNVDKYSYLSYNDVVSIVMDGIGGLCLYRRPAFATIPQTTAGCADGFGFNCLMTLSGWSHGRCQYLYYALRILR